MEMDSTELIHDAKQIFSLTLFKYGKPLFGGLVLSERGIVVTDRNESIEEDVARE